MRGVFIHILGDALGSVVVMISAAVTMVARKYANTCPGIHHNHSNNTSMSMTNHTEHTDNIHDCTHADPDWVLCIDPILRYVRFL